MHVLYVPKDKGCVHARLVHQLPKVSGPASKGKELSYTFTRCSKYIASDHFSPTIQRGLLTRYRARRSSPRLERLELFNSYLRHPNMSIENGPQLQWSLGFRQAFTTAGRHLRRRRPRLKHPSISNSTGGLPLIAP